MEIIKKIFCKDICGLINEYVMISKNTVMINKLVLCSELKLIFKEYNNALLFKVLHNRKHNTKATVLDYINLINKNRKKQNIISLVTIDDLLD